MASNGTHNPSTSFSGSPPMTVDARASIDSERSANTSSPVPNGIPDIDGDADPVAKLQRELDRTREEKDALATQYRNLLAKLTTMRTTLGNKLKQDAEELDRREQLVQQLTAQNDDLTATVETLKEELITSHEEAERASNELDHMRSRALEENAQETLMRERELRETQTELERCRMEREEWERTALQERALVDDLRSAIETYKRELELEREAREADFLEMEAEREKSGNLQSVLQDFQTAKDHELRQAVKDYESQLNQVTQSLAEFKHRALTSELALEESTTNSSRTQELEKEVKEKNLLIGKLRHETVIINEHLMEALRRLRRNSSDTNVDRRLVTNVLLSFLTTPRADPKRFEMLSLLATILSWNDLEREKAGLQRAGSGTLGGGGGGGGGGSFWRGGGGSPAKSLDLEKTDETESFSRLWVEFLLTEASGASPAPSSSTSSSQADSSSLPGTPTAANYPTSPPKGTRRLASYGTPSAMMSSPNLVLPGRKGKEREV
ncbi:hypothetical protein Hypma_002229 [Hypsizygus marmoreus]|uniref:GRIP domain-containing protein n=1 Tax=Hypsizygus marmoreus TaxID=39966 RepID=A0A369K0B2_HYPMA|nr:hypothetical protein Hypma_002229 [Hypsizygus marmoreus]